MSWRPKAIKSLKILGIAAVVVVGLVVTLAGLLLLQPVRDRVLATALPRVHSALPGDLAVDSAAWPSPGTLEFEGVLWTDGPDTLASVDLLRASVDLTELVRRDVHVREVVLVGARADIPAIVGAFPSSGEDDEEEQEKGESSFPRGGELPGVPSMAVDRLAIDATRVRISESVDLRDVAIRAVAEARRGRDPSLKLSELSLVESVGGTTVDSLWLSLDPSNFEIEGDGIVRAGHGDVYYLDCHSTTDREFSVRLTAGRDAAPPDVVGIVLEGRAEHDGGQIGEVDFTLRFLTPGTEDLLRFSALRPVLAEPFANLAPLEGLGGVVRGVVELSPAYAAEATVDLQRSSWIDTMHVAAAYREKTVSIESLLIGLPGLEVVASGRIPPTGGAASARIRADGTQWLTRIIPDVSAPESLAVDLTIDADGLVGVPATSVRIRGNAAANGVVVDTLDVAATLPRAKPLQRPARTQPREEPLPYAIDLFIEAMGVSLATHADVTTSHDIAVSLTAPEAREASASETSIQLAGDVGYDPAHGSVRLSGLRVSGAAGDVTVDADLDSLQAGSFAVVGEWFAPPPILFSKLSVDSLARAAIDSAWGEDGPFSLRIAGEITRRGGGPAATAAGELRLPGPRDLAPLIGSDIHVDDLGPIEGSLEVATGTCDSVGSFDVRLDLGRTSWVDTALVDVRGCGPSLEIDTVLLSFESLRITAVGGGDADAWDLRANVALADSLLLTRFMAGPDFPSVALDASAHLTGSRGNPRLRAAFGACYASNDMRFPDIRGRARVDGDSLDARVIADGRSYAYGVYSDSVSVTHLGRVGADGLSGKTSFDMRGPDASFMYATHWEKDGGITIHGDTLHLRMVDEELRSRRPFEASVSPGGLFRINGLHLEGSIGKTTADGYIAADSADLAVHVVFHPPRKPGFIALADRLWPDSLLLDATVDGPRTFHVKGDLAGVTLSGGIPVETRFEVRADTGGALARVTVDSPQRRLLDLQGHLPSYEIGDELRDGPMVLDLRLDRFPLPASPGAMLADSVEELGRLDGTIAVRGTAEDPCAVAALHCDFTGAEGKELSKYGLDVEGLLAGSAPLDTALTRIRREWFRTELKDGDAAAGLTASLSLDKSGAPVVTGNLFYPVSVSLAPFATVVSKEEDVIVNLETVDIALTDFDTVLPPDIDLEGTCKVVFIAKGPAANPWLNGSVTTRRIQIVSARGAQISPDVEVDLGGTLTRPSITGKVQVNNGFIRVPEQRSQLHPAEGTSLLWESADSVRAIADTTTAEQGLDERDNGDDDEGGPGIDIDVSVVIPGGFRIIGSRMNVELSGDLHLVQKGELPVLTGQLVPLGGQLMFMGRSFELRRGSVNFYGGDEMNPSFDLQLDANVSSYRVEIKLTGTMKEPLIELTSDPQLSESDIMSLLVFGTPMNELNTSQSGLLQQRTAEILMMYGAIKLQEQMSQQMGVDIITIQQSTRKPDESALVVGKYLNNRTLLKYEQNLENSGTYLINLEYLLTKRIKFETFIDQASETGMEINWSKDY
jgi:hypothetical protein